MASGTSNLNSGPWQALRRQRNLHLYWKFQRGFDAYRQGEPVFAPSGWTDEEKEQYRKGWEAAQRNAWTFRS